MHLPSFYRIFYDTIQHLPAEVLFFFAPLISRDDGDALIIHRIREKAWKVDSPNPPQARSSVVCRSGYTVLRHLRFRNNPAFLLENRLALDCDLAHTPWGLPRKHIAHRSPKSVWENAVQHEAEPPWKACPWDKSRAKPRLPRDRNHKARDTDTGLLALSLPRTSLPLPVFRVGLRCIRRTKALRYPYNS